MSILVIVAILVFLAVFVLISTEIIHKALASLGGAALFILLGIVPAGQAFHEIDWSVIFLLVSLMLLVAVTRRTGVFQFIAIKAAKIAKGNPVGIMILMSLVCAVSAAFLGTVTTVLIMAPVLILISVELGISPLPYLLAAAISANLGGVSTLIGDPTSVVIGSAANFSFLDFVSNNGPASLMVMAMFLTMFYFFFKKDLRVSNERRARIMEFDESKSISDYPMLWKSLGVIALVITGFIFGSFLDIEPAVVALAGAVILMILTAPHELDNLILEVEWGTILFFVGLFIMVLGLENLGIIKMLAGGIMGLTGGDLLLTAVLIVWASGIISAFVDNIPFVVSMIPLIHDISGQLDLLGQNGAELVIPLWWALSLGAVFGGNGTLIGASANVVTAGIAGKNGHQISFGTFMKYGSPVALGSLVLGTAWIILRYFVFG